MKNIEKIIACLRIVMAYIHLLVSRQQSFCVLLKNLYCLDYFLVAFAIF